jgi:alpha-galactosidase
MLEVGNEGLTIAESRAHFSLWCMLAAPLMAGNDVRNMSDEIREILTNKEVIGIDQDPLGKQGYRYMDHPGKQIWAKQLSDGKWAVCIFNSGEDILKVRLNWSHFSFLKGRYEIRDLWKTEDIGTTKEIYTGEIASHDVILFKLSPAAGNR